MSTNPRNGHLNSIEEIIPSIATFHVGFSMQVSHCEISLISGRSLIFSDLLSRSLNVP